MKNHLGKIAIIAAIVAIVIWVCAYLTHPLNSEIQITSPGKEAISSPVSITGSVKGSWFFEAVFPITIVDGDGKVIGQGQAHAKGEWMTTDFVPFEASIAFTVPQCSSDQCHHGSIIFKNDNPSDDRSRDKSFEIPVTFK